MYLTKRQKETLDYITGYLSEHGYAPTLEEIGSYFGLSSPATVYKHVQQLVHKGYLRKARNQGRGLELVEVEPLRTIEAPLLGQLVAGRSLEAIRPARTVNLPPEFNSLAPIYVLRVRGDWLNDEQLADGDLLVVEDRSTAENGETVVALLRDDLPAVGRIYREAGGVRLQPAHPGREPLWLPEGQLQIRGVLVGLLRRYERQ